MDRQRSDASARRFSDYLDVRVSVIGPMRDDGTGLLLPCERKSVEPMAAMTAPEQTSAQHQSLLPFIAPGAGSTRPWRAGRSARSKHRTRYRSE